jgi:phosphohistidine phosphatase SixA
MIVFALRHADRTDADDLSPAGRDRAKLLARMLAESGISIAFRSHFIRAAKTLLPLEAKLAGALQVNEVRFEDADDPDEYATKVATAVKALPADAVVAVVGHSDTVGPTIEKLGGEPIDPIGGNEFDRLLVLFIAPDGPVTLLKLRYGAQTPA